MRFLVHLYVKLCFKIVRIICNLSDIHSFPICVFLIFFSLQKHKLTFSKYMLLIIEPMIVGCGHGRFLWSMKLINLSQGMLFHVLMCVLGKDSLFMRSKISPQSPIFRTGLQIYSVTISSYLKALFPLTQLDILLLILY